MRLTTRSRARSTQRPRAFCANSRSCAQSRCCRATARTSHVAYTNGHGTFVASLAAGSSSNGEGIAGMGGEARLYVMKASTEGLFTDFDTAAGITYAVERGARIVNLSLGG